MRVPWMPLATVVGISTLCTGAAADPQQQWADTFMTATALEAPAALDAPTAQLAMLPQYRVDPVPPAPTMSYGFPTPNYAGPNYAAPNYANSNYAAPNYAAPSYAAPNYAAPNYAVPSYPAYGNAYGQRMDGAPVGPSQPGQLVPMPEQLAVPTPADTLSAGSLSGGAEYPDRMSQLEAELAMLRSAIGERVYSGLPGGSRPSYAPRHTGFYADFAFVFARPWFTDASNFGIYDAPNNLSVARSFAYDYELTPRVWLGYVDPRGRGVRARYWQFDHSGRPRSLTQTDPNIFYGADWIHPWGMITAMTTDVGQTMSITNSISVETVDLEATQTLNFGWTEILFGGGLRYANLDKRFDADIPGVDFLIARQDFEGIGPTISMDVRLPIGYCEGLGLYGGGRYSILFGDSWAYGENGSDPFDYTLDEVLSIGEIEIGLEYTRSISYLGLCVVRAGYEGQVWYEAGSPSNVGGDLGFEGISIKFGFIR